MRVPAKDPSPRLDDSSSRTTVERDTKEGNLSQDKRQEGHGIFDFNGVQEGILFVLVINVRPEVNTFARGVTLVVSGIEKVGFTCQTISKRVNSLLP